jgi:hypothetical protein
VHVSGWALAFERALGARMLRLRGPAESVLSAPTRATPDGHRAPLGPGDLRLPGGRTPHEFLHTGASGQRVEVERFETVRSDATIEVPARIAAGDGDRAGAAPATLDVLVEFDDRLPEGPAAAKLERYDHMLSGWLLCTPRYGHRATASPLVVFVCRSRARARECARGADRVLTACRAYAGEYPTDWQYPGRAAIVFAAERDIHEGLMRAYRVPPLPPAVRVAVAGGRALAREPEAHPTSLLPVGRHR